MREIDELEKRLTKSIKKLLIFAIVVSVIIGIVAAVCMDSSSYDDDNFFVSPFMIFMYTILSCFLIIYLSSFPLYFFVLMYKTKVATMNNTYAIMKMLETSTDCSGIEATYQKNKPNDIEDSEPEIQSKCDECGYIGPFDGEKCPLCGKEK